MLVSGIQLVMAMATHSSTLAWKIPWREEPGGLQSMGSLRVRHNWMTSLSFLLSCIGEGNGNPLQCSCLENPRDRGPGGLPSMGSHRVEHDWSDLAEAAGLLNHMVSAHLTFRGTVNFFQKWLFYHQCMCFWCPIHLSTGLLLLLLDLLTIMRDYISLMTRETELPYMFLEFLELPIKHWEAEVKVENLA